MTDRISEPGGIWVFRQLSAVHVELPETAGAALVKERQEAGRLDDPVNRAEHFRRTHGKAVRNRIVPMEVGDAFLEDRFRGRPEDRCILEILYEVKTVWAHFSLPH